MSSEFIGVFGADDPVTALRSTGVEPSWSGGAVAFGGSSIATDLAGTVVVCGEVLLDRAAELRAVLRLPESSDAQLLAELYARYGASAGGSASGLVAASIWDAVRGELHLVRDSVGARTIYYTHEAGSWWFASRLHTLRRGPARSRPVSLQALRDYLVFSYVPGAQTMWEGVRELRPGTSLELPSTRLVQHWEPSENVASESQSLEHHARSLRPLLEEAVAACLPGERRVGAFLSGGLDSSLVTAIAARRTDVSTYSIHFGDGYANELEYAALVAQHTGTRHHVVECNAAMVRDYMAETMGALDDPIGDPLTVPNFVLGRAARSEVDVIVNGEGGDPCFGGPKNVPMLLYELYGATESRETAYLKAYRKCYDDLAELLTPEVRADLSGVPPPEAAVTPYLRDGPMSGVVNRLMHANVRMKGADHILTKVNNLSSANLLTAHSPLFHRRIVEESFAIPPHHKTHGSVEKVVLKAAVADLLPAAIVHRPKSGMAVPVERWMRNELIGFAKDNLLSRRARIRDYVRQDTLQQWLKFDASARPRQGAKLWLVLALELWLQTQESHGSDPPIESRPSLLGVARVTR